MAPIPLQWFNLLGLIKGHIGSHKLK